MDANYITQMMKSYGMLNTASGSMTKDSPIFWDETPTWVQNLDGSVSKVGRVSISPDEEAVWGGPGTFSGVGAKEAEAHRRWMDILQNQEPPAVTNATSAFKQLARSIEKIEATPFTGAEKERLETKIARLQSVGATRQAEILEKQLRLRQRLVALKDWDYPVLKRTTLEKFQSNNYRVIVHIHDLEHYVGNTDAGDEKDRLIPDDVLDKIEQARERRLFDAFQVMWAEKVKDPIVFGVLDGCQDMFFVAEWDDDITFEQLLAGEQ